MRAGGIGAQAATPLSVGRPNAACQYYQEQPGLAVFFPSGERAKQAERGGVGIRNQAPQVPTGARLGERQALQAIGGDGKPAEALEGVRAPVSIPQERAMKAQPSRS